jgi:hypothetical protein
LVGKWLPGAVADATCLEIQRRLSEDLEKVADREGGWTTLYRDRGSLGLWELSYPESHLHGGGPPKLEPLTRDEAIKRYGKNVAV